jgi:DNA-binding MarR family transcriptional regulator
MNTTVAQRKQAAAGLEQLASLVRAQSWRHDDTPSLPPTQGAVLRILDGLPQGLRAKQLAERVGVSAPSLSDSLKALESKSWIVRIADPNDGRASIVRLTTDGGLIAKQMLSGSRGLGGLLRKLDSSDLGAFLRVTQLLVAEAQQQGLATGPRTCLGCRYFRPHASGDASKPHFCDFVQQAFGDPELRVDCAEREPADHHQAAASAKRFRQQNPT